VEQIRIDQESRLNKTGAVGLFQQHLQGLQKHLLVLDFAFDHLVVADLDRNTLRFYFFGFRQS